MPLPTDDLIIWASSDVNLPNLAGPNKVKPIDDLILKGWDFKQKPAADEFNYVLNNLGMHVSYLEESKTYTFSGDVTGTVTSTGSDDVTFNVSVTDNSHNHISANISDATSGNSPNTVVRRDVNGDIAANYIRAVAYFDGDLHGNADTASALQTARTISISGDGSGSVSFNGTSDISIPLVIADNSHNHTSANISDATSGNSPNTVVRRDVNGDIAANYIRAVAYFDGDLHGNADTASALQTARTISISGDGSGSVSFNGTSDISIPLVIADNSHNHTSANISDATSGNSPNTVVRRDVNGDVAARTFVGDLHGTAAYATTLQTDRTINGTSFNGSANITTNSWGTSRTFALTGAITGNVSVDGSANISMTTTDTVSVTNIRLGTEVTFRISNATGTPQYAAGYVLVGATNDGNYEVDTLFTRPLQQYINGVWYTIGNI